MNGDPSSASPGARAPRGLDSSLRSQDRIERIGYAGMLRGMVAGILGVGLWIALLLGVLSLASRDGEVPSVAIVFGAMLLTAGVSALPLILSQMTRGQWVLEDTGIKETVRPLVSFLPFGLHRDRLVLWKEIGSCGIREFRMRGNRDGKPRVIRYFRMIIPGQPSIEFQRKEKTLDTEFDGFVAECNRRIGGGAGAT